MIEPKKLTWEEYDKLSVEEQDALIWEGEEPNLNFNKKGFIEECLNNMVEYFEYKFETEDHIARIKSIEYANEILQKVINDNTHNGYIYGEITNEAQNIFNKTYGEHFNTNVKYNLKCYQGKDFTEITKNYRIFELFKGYLYRASSNIYSQIGEPKYPILDYGLCDSFVLSKIADNIKEKKFVVEDIDKFKEECINEYIELYKKCENSLETEEEADKFISQYKKETIDKFFKKLGEPITECWYKEDINQEFCGLDIFDTIKESTEISGLRNLLEMHLMDGREDLMEIEYDDFFNLFDRVIAENFEHPYEGYIYTEEFTQSELVEHILYKIKELHRLNGEEDTINT